jgi:hypothetical protein
MVKKGVVAGVVQVAAPAVAHDRLLDLFFVSVEFLGVVEAA